MKNKELFDRTISILVNAYFNNTLEHSNCHACAVGNMVAANNGITVSNIDVTWLSDEEPDWGRVHCVRGFGSQQVDPSKYSGNAKKQIDSTGYTWQQTAAIEKAFESFYEEDDLDGFKGLMAVVDVLIEIHEGSEEEKQEAKSMFVKTK